MRSQEASQRGSGWSGSHDQQIHDDDPLLLPLRCQADGGAAEESEEEDEDGPTFGDPDAPSEDEDEEVGEGDLDMGGMGNTNDVMYADFFAPPAQKKRKNKKGRPNPHNFPAATEKGQTQEDDAEDL